MNVDLSPERWRLLETLFYKATDMEPRDRAIFLDQACAGDVNIRKEVDSLLAAADQTLSYLQEPASEAAREMIGGSAFAGKLIGHWRIVQTLGDGGMGKVYLATRADEVYQQNAALKLMRADLVDSPDMLVRFRIERQILAKLNHPNIARLLDGGVSSDGLPYLVMEYVEGVPIDVYCRDHRLSIEDRLRLFRTVCEAVEYAEVRLGEVLVAEQKALAAAFVTRSGTRRNACSVSTSCVAGCGSKKRIRRVPEESRPGH